MKQQFSEIKLSSRSDKEMERLSKEVKELKEKQKEREKFFWSVANEQSVKIESLKKQVDEKGEQKQNQN